VARRTRQHPVEFGRVTTHAETVRLPELEDMGRRVLDAMGYRGISEVEFMRDPRDGTFKLIEINARFWAWHSLAIKAGVDLPYLMYLNALGESVQAGEYEEGIHWLRLLVDLPVSVSQATKGKLDLGAYLRSWRGKRTFSVFSLRDPLPFFAEVLMVPYILKVRGA
jgi:predicted ATP-grasp superfamily ATP-dependent carboligase